MKITILLSLAAVATAFVVPDEALTNQILTKFQEESESFLNKLPSKEDIFSRVEEVFNGAATFSGNALDTAINAVTNAGKEALDSFEYHPSMMAFDTEAWLDPEASAVEDFEIFESEGKLQPPHHKKPHHPHHGKSNMTIYQLINTSKHTTEFAKLINEFDDIVAYLNSTKANRTIFVPTDAAFKKLPDHHKKPSKDLIGKILSYHVSPGFYPALRILASHTIPSTWNEEALGGNVQRLRVRLTLRGLTVNFYSRVIVSNIFAANGVIHGIDSILFPPPPAMKIIELLPGEFSTLQLAMTKTGVCDGDSDKFKLGGTYFAPTNMAFKMLGPKINAFLFSKYGLKYLKALLKYHVVPNQTLYSDAYYHPKSKGDTVAEIDDMMAFPKRRSHIDLPTLLDGKSLSIDIARFGGFITMKINGFNSVAIQDGLAKDGVIHVLNNVLIPPKTPGGAMYQGEDITVEDLVSRLDSFVDPSEL